jgi:hypothetical protein
LQQNHAVSLYYPHCRRKPFKGLEFKAGQVDLLKLLGGIGHEILTYRFQRVDFCRLRFAK